MPDVAQGSQRSEGLETSGQAASRLTWTLPMWTSVGSSSTFAAWLVEVGEKLITFVRHMDSMPDSSLVYVDS